MRLLYWYTCFLDSSGKPTEHHGIEQFELNLNTDTKYSFDRETRIFSKEPLKTPLPHGFWGRKPLYNINVIVGSNGAGKTTVLHSMMDTLQELYNCKIESNNETIILVEYKEKKSCKRLIIHLNGKASGISQFPDSLNKISFKIGPIDPNNSFIQLVNRTKIIYITNTLSQLDDARYQRMHDLSQHIYKSYLEKHFAREEFIYNCSLCGIIRQDMDSDSVKNRDLLSSFFINEYYKQVKCVFDRTQYEHLVTLKKKGINVPIPEKLTITMHKVSSINGLSFNLYQYKNNSSHVSQQIAYRLCVLCFITFIRNVAIDNKLLDILTEADIPRVIDFSAFNKLFEKVCESNQYMLGCEEEYIIFIRYVCTNTHKLENFTVDEKSTKSMEEGREFTIVLEIFKNDNDWFLDFMKLYRRTCLPHYYLDFSWGLSSGENNLLRFFSTLFSTFRYSDAPLFNIRYSKNEEQKYKCDSVFLFMDEADLTYHPEWQRQLIQILTAFLPLEFSKNEKKCGVSDLQVVLTTHSPLLLGDIPPNNVKYLGISASESESIEYKNTFGQNIHSILKNSFFLSNGSIGAFAVEKINNTAKKLRKPNKLTERKMDECKAIIDLVCPGILKGKLMTLYIEAKSKKIPSNSKRNMVKKLEENIKYFSTDELKEVIEKSYSELESRKQ